MTEVWGPAHFQGAARCGCPECQPGPGLEQKKLRAGVSTRRIRMQNLLQRRYLTPTEEAELDNLLYEFIHANKEST